MALNDFASWVPVETGDDVLLRVEASSVIEAFARAENLSSNSKEVPRSGGFVMAVGAKGSTLTEDDSVADNVVLTARKIRAGVRIAEEDIEDSLANIVDAKSAEWAISYAKFLDHAALGTTAAADGSTVPFESVYKVASDNALLIQTAGDPVYDDLNDVVSVYEQSEYFDDERTLVVAHPEFKSVIRGLVDSNNRPIFVPGNGENPDTLFDYQVRWTTAAKTDATATQAPAGNALLTVVNRDFLIRGDRSNPEFRVDYQEITDDHVLQGRARKAFAVGRAEAVSVLEITAVS